MNPFLKSLTIHSLSTKSTLIHTILFIHTHTHITYAHEYAYKHPQHISTISASGLCSQNKYYFELPTEDVQDNTLLMAFNPEQCSACSLEYEEARRRPTMGAQQFRFNIQSVTYLPLPKCTNTMSCNPAT